MRNSTIKWFFRLFAAFSILLLQCSNHPINDDDTNPGKVTNCEITDKSKLEDIQIFPAENSYIFDISNVPVDTRSEAIIKLIGSPGIHADFGSGLWEGNKIGIPFILVCKDQTKFPIVYRENSYDGNYGDQSDAGPFPIPLNAPVEGNLLDGDRHCIAVDIDNRMLYELYNATVDKEKGTWSASSGVVWDLKINGKRTPGYTSADASGMPMLPFLVRYDEIERGVIDHPIRFTLSRAKTMKAYTSPASHWSAGDNKDMKQPTPYGMRLRLKPGFDVSGYSKTNQVILNAMKKYGLIFADIGSDFFISGAPDERWNNDDLSMLKKVTASNFEVVQMGTIVTP